MFLPFPPLYCAIAMVVLTTVYTIVSGFYGVVYNDLFQSGIIVTGVTFAELEPSSATVLAFLSAFISSVAMWWIYFDVGARRGSELIEHDDRPGLIGRQAYTYGHIPIVAGIVVIAVADEQVLTHPTGHLEPYYTAALVGGSLLFICGAMLFKRMTSGSGGFVLLMVGTTSSHSAMMRCCG